MYQGTWKCGSCGGVITELPFEPRGEVGLMCKKCFAKSTGGGGNGGSKQTGGSGSNGERTMHKGDWKCSGCSKAITELPFKPRDTSNLLCIDCFKQSRA